MERSEEIRRIVERWFAALSAGDIEAVFSRFSDQPGMLAFSSARRAVACAQAIQRGLGSAFADGSPPIRVRIGVHTGDALQEAQGLLGKTVHYAARVASQALGGEVLVSNVVHDLVAGPGIDFLESRQVELKGLDGLHRLFSINLA